MSNCITWLYESESEIACELKWVGWEQDLVKVNASDFVFVFVCARVNAWLSKCVFVYMITSEWVSKWVCVRDSE